MRQTRAHARPMRMPEMDRAACFEAGRWRVGMEVAWEDSWGRPKLSSIVLALIALELVSEAIVLPPRGNIGDGAAHIAFADAVCMP